MPRQATTASSPAHLQADTAGPRPRVNLALQGGGSHGAFTWGVLDRLLDDDGVDIGALSGTSAGALNGAVLLSGHALSLRKAPGDMAKARRNAQRALASFWKDVSRHGPLFSPMTLDLSDGRLKPQFNFDQLPVYQWMTLFTRAFSPYEFNPLNLNPLRDVVRRHVVVDALHEVCCRDGIQLFVTATSARTGQPRVFTGAELSIDALMASACLPFIFQAVNIDGEDYWDGGYTGNPALFPLIYDTDDEDIVLVKINPLSRSETPTRSMEIIERLSEITFNTSLIGEMRAIAFVKRLLKEDRLPSGRYKDLRLHMVADDDGLAPFNASSKTNTDANFLKALHKLGHAAASRWLAAHRADLGQRSTLDIEGTFLNPPKDVAA
ncbi:patatin-like phospholipase family protein [Aquabacterium lacunae]|uniref:Patatin-like phospholipase family protein n=1 Tax=Aquabacterium lacunae TaxID=2528630 RepID=A0A4Q9H492_9BURK|nr:patatin-like phospholipase family protein [Aquabacterium lacunae]TBO31262.1 patatin-like phospholipase family protein [Aquabacterium lacunae]